MDEKTISDYELRTEAATIAMAYLHSQNDSFTMTPEGFIEFINSIYKYLSESTEDLDTTPAVTN